MRINYRIISFFVFLSFLCAGAQAQILGFEDAVSPEFVTSARARAMGNAYIAKADDAAAAFYNPAGLGTVRKTHFHLSNFHFDVNDGWRSAGLGGSIGDAFSNFTDVFSPESTRDLLASRPGTLSHGRFQFMPNFTSRYFSAGYLYSTQDRGIVLAGADHPSGVDTFEYASRTDHGPYASLNLSLFGGIFKFGGTATFLNRSEAIGSSALSEPFVLNENKGSAVIITGGTRLTLPFRYLPTFAATIHNAADQGFSGGVAGIRRSIDLGASITPQIGNKVRMHVEVNWKDFTDAHDVDFDQRLAAGIEFDFNRTIFLRFGWGDGLGSGGIGMKTQKIEVDLTTYGINPDNANFNGEDDRRYALSVSTGF